MTRSPLAALLLAVALVATACGGSPPGGPAAVTAGPPTSGGPTVAPATPAPTAPTDGGAGPEAIDVCGLLSEDGIREVTGSGVASRSAGIVQGIYPDGCTWILDDTGASEIDVGVITLAGRAYYDEHFGAFAGEDGYEPLTGIGDAALADTTVGDVVIAVQGDTMVGVQYVVYPTANDGTAETLTRLVLEAIAG